MWALTLLLTGLHICASAAKIDSATLRRTKLAAYDDQYTVNSACECRLRCSVQEACLAASYKAPSTCWVFSGGTGGGQSGGSDGGQSGSSDGGLELQQDDKFITWLKNGEMALSTTEVTTEPTSTITPSTTPTTAFTTTPTSTPTPTPTTMPTTTPTFTPTSTPTTTPTNTPTTAPITTPTITPTTVPPSTTVPPAPLFFKSANYITTPTLDQMKTQCALGGGVPGSILTEQEYAWIKASSLLSDMRYNRMIVPAFAEGDKYVWYDGAEVLSTGVFQEGENFINDPNGTGPYVVLDTSFNLVKTKHYPNWSWYNVLCKNV